MKTDVAGDKKPSYSTLTEQQWRAVCREWEVDKPPQKKFCAQRNINYFKFVYWRSQLLKEEGLSRSSSFVPVKVKQQATLMHHTSHTLPQLQLQLPGNITLAIHTVLDEASWRQLFKALSIIND